MFRTRNFWKNVYLPRKCLSKLISDNGNEYQLLKDKLYIGITQPWSKIKLISSWESNRDLKNCIHASMHIPFYTTYIRKYKGKLGLDGGFSRDLVAINKNTIGISCQHLTDISPQEKLSLIRCLFPFNPSDSQKICQLGKKDTSLWLKNNTTTNGNLLNLPPVSTLRQIGCIFAWFLRYLEELIVPFIRKF